MREPTPDQKLRMHDTTKLLIGAIVLGLFLVILITAIQDKDVDQFWTTSVLQKGGYGL